MMALMEMYIAISVPNAPTESIPSASLSIRAAPNMRIADAQKVVYHQTIKKRPSCDCHGRFYWSLHGGVHFWIRSISSLRRACSPPRLAW